MSDVTLRQLLQVGAHFGHQTRYWSPKMAPYIFGDRNKIHIINLEKTLPLLQEAVNYLGSVAAQGGKIMFVGTKRQASRHVREQAQRCNTPYVDHRWLGGMLTNYKTVKNSISKLKEMETRLSSDSAKGLNKKELLDLTRQRDKLGMTLNGIKDMEGLPDVLFVIDIEEEYIAVAEAKRLGIPVVAVVDTNCNPEGVDYLIPANDDSGRAIQLYLSVVADAISDARATARDKAEAAAAAAESARAEKAAASEAAAAESAASAKEAASESSEAVEAAAAEAAEEVKAEAVADTAEEAAKPAAKKKATKKKVVRKKDSDD